MPFDKEKLNRRSSELYKLVAQFIVHEKLETQTFLKDQLYLEYLGQELLKDLFESAFSGLEKSLEKSSWKDLDYFKQRLELELSLFRHESMHKIRKGDVNLQAVNDRLDEYFMLHKLILLNLMKNRSKIINVEYQLSWKTALLQFLEADQSKQAPVIQLNKKVLQMLEDPQKHFQDLKSLLQKYADQISKSELVVILNYMTNNVKHVFSKDIDLYYKELFDLYRWQLKEGVLHSDGFIHHSKYKNILTTAINLKAFDWAESFIEINRDLIIPENHKKDSDTLMKATLLNAQGKQEEAQQLLLDLNPKEVYYKLSRRSLELRIYYELKETRVLSNALDTFKTFVQRQQVIISAGKVKSYLLFVRYFKRLLNKVQGATLSEAYYNNQVVRSKTAQKDLLEFADRIKEEPIFYGKKWLLDKIKDLLNN